MNPASQAALILMQVNHRLQELQVPADFFAGDVGVNDFELFVYHGFILDIRSQPNGQFDCGCIRHPKTGQIVRGLRDYQP